jgi:hypothetical protein
MSYTQERLDEIADAVAQMKSAAETASRSMGADSQKHVVALNLGMIIGLAVHVEGIVKDEKRFASMITTGC